VAIFFSLQTLAALNYRTDLGSWGILDYSLTGPATFVPTSNALFLPFMAEVYPPNSATECPLPHKSLIYQPSGRMVDLILDVFAVNSGLYQYYNSQQFDLTITNAMLPPGFPMPLRTDAWGALIPQLQVTYPDMNMVLLATLADLPSFTTAAGAAQLSISFFLNVMVVPTSGPMLSAFTLDVLLAPAVAVSASQQPTGPVLELMVSNATAVALKVVASKIGPIDLTAVNNLVATILDSVIIPEVNERVRISYFGLGIVLFFQSSLLPCIV
jgi:hypothetical protein